MGIFASSQPGEGEVEMNDRRLACVGALATVIAVASLAPVPAAGQEKAEAAAEAAKTGSS